MDFFDKLGKKASEAYKVTADKTGKIAKEAKIKMKINELKSEIDTIYEEIGKTVYQKHVKNEGFDIGKDVEDYCVKIDYLSDEIETNLKHSLELKDKKQCPKCYKEIDIDVKFCPECGEKQENIEEKIVKDVEIIDKIENNKDEDKLDSDESKDTENIEVDDE